MSKKKTVGIVVCTALITCLLTNLYNDIMYARSHGEVQKKVETVANYISNYSLYEKNDSELADAAADGMVKALGDKYSQYVSDEENTAYNDYLSQRYVGVGATITSSAEGYIEIIEVTPGGPASDAGLKAGDIIISMDGESCLGMTPTAASAKMRGIDLENPEGTTVNVEVSRNGEVFSTVLTREKVTADTVYSQMLEDNIGYMQITQFRVKMNEDDETPTTFELFRQKLNELAEQGMKKLIIDLRSNGGGDLEQACDIAGLFLNRDDLIIYVEDKDGNRQNYTAEEGENITLPIVILTNGDTASASEVFTGALKDHNRATIVGTKTYGKGVVQSVYPMYDNSTLTITTGKYYTPSGVCIHEQGIEPDIYVNFEYDADGNIVSTEDVQLNRAVEELKKVEVDESDMIMPSTGGEQ